MKTFCTSLRLWALGCVAAVGLWGAPQAFAADDDPDPDITIKTSYFEWAGVDNIFTINMDVDETIYIVVDCGFGPVEYELEPSQNGTWIPCIVTEDGLVRMWTDKPEVINYFYCQGGHITDIDLSKLTALQVLDLSNNDLGKIDLSNNLELEYIDLGTNKFDVEPLSIGVKPKLKLLEMECVGAVAPDFNMSDYPELLSFAAFSTRSLDRLDPTGCPKLMRLSADVTGLTSLDLSKNPELQILSIADTYITSLDLTHNPKLTQLFIGHDGRTFLSDYKFTELDLSKNTQLQVLNAPSNRFRTLDISKCPGLSDLNLSWNLLESFDYAQNDNLYRVNISNNCLDFATLPLYPAFGPEYYYSQRPMPVQLSYPVGAQIDLSKKVLREDTDTEMKLFGISQADISAPVELSSEYYDYKDGIITLKKEYNDSIYASFSNLSFPDCVLTTTKFMVKNPEHYGVPVNTLSFTPMDAPGSNLEFGLGIGGASEANPRSAFVDFGDGELVPVPITCQVPDSPNVTGVRSGSSAVKVYVNDGDVATGLYLNSTMLYSIDLEKAPELRDLTLIDTDLSYIDLKWQRCLQTLKLTGNRFGSLDLTTNIVGYDKNALHTVDVSDNQLYELSLLAKGQLRHLNVSHNSLSNVAINEAYQLLTLDISYNQFQELPVANLDSLHTLNISGNLLKTVEIPWQQTLRNLDCSDNALTFTSLPFRPGQLSGEYVYAPQNDIRISQKGPNANLSRVGVEIDGVATEFVWRKADGSILTEGTDYEMRDGIVTFKDYSLGKVYCTMTNSVYPDLTMKTSEMLVAEPPTNAIAWMDVADAIPAASSMYLSMAAANGEGSLYIDWAGEGKDFTEFVLEPTYIVFPIEPVAGRRAVIYTYEDPTFLTTFSLYGLPLKSGDFSGMKELTLFAASNTGTPEIKLPESEALSSLSLDGNDLTSIDASRLQNLTVLNLDNNKFRTFDLAAFPKLQLASMMGNGMKEIKLDNPDLWHLALSANEFEEFSFAGLPSLHQVDLNANRLKKIDINGPRLLRTLHVASNCLDFQTLPIVPETVTSYYYGNQARIPAMINGMTVDLSSQASRDGVATDFYWCLDEPYMDEDGLYAETLVAGEDYTIADGVTTFKHEVTNVCCMMVNELFPKTYLLTDLMTITDSGVDAAVLSAAQISVDGRRLTISAGEDASYGVYAADGLTIASGSISDGSVEVELPAAGIYVVKAGKASMKVAVK